MYISKIRAWDVSNYLPYTKNEEFVFNLQWMFLELFEIRILLTSEIITVITKVFYHRSDSFIQCCRQGLSRINRSMCNLLKTDNNNFLKYISDQEIGKRNHRHNNLMPLIHANLHVAHFFQNDNACFLNSNGIKIISSD